MDEITLAEFNAHGIHRHPATRNFFEEKKWFKHAALLGLVLFDHDGEWGWVLLAKHKDSNYRAIDMGASLKTQVDAVTLLEKAFLANAGVVEVDGGPPVTEAEVVKMLAAKGGHTEDHARRILQSLAVPQKRNN